ncbi:MAG: mammalian cell entry protein [Pseudomonadota bacterium]|jgi:phospholipid/cholesterol/gamma-HCH transport system substrate-binding protein
MADPQPAEPPRPPIPHAGAKTVAMIVMTLLLLGGFVLYVMFARGVFEENQRLVLLAENSEGVTIGMDMTFTGFPIGRVRRIELGDDGKAHIHIDIPTKDARWLRTSSVFTLERGVVGGAKLRAFTGLLDDPPLPDGARRDVLIGDATAGIPHLVSSLRELADNLVRMTGADAPLNASIANVRTVTGAMTGPRGALDGLLGPAGARRIHESLEQTNRLLAQTNARLYGQGGLMDDAQRATGELHALLTDVRASLKKTDALLDEARAIAVNARVATDDLDALRNEVEANLRRVSGLIDEVNRKWPFARERELKLP